MRKTARPIPEISEKDKARFTSKIQTGSVPKNADGQCLEWTDYRDPNGYGIFSIKAKMFLAHRISFAINQSPPPTHLMVLHKCDNPSCVNPEHLFLGTNADNVADMVRKGRNSTKPVPYEKRAKGVMIAGSKLTDEKARQVAVEYKSGGVSQSKLAKRFGVNQSQISRIVNGTAWEHAL